LPEFYLIYVTADLEKRYARLIKRRENEDDKNKTLEQFKLDNKAEAEQQISEVAKIANYKIDNNNSIEELYEQAEKIISELQKL